MLRARVVTALFLVAGLLVVLFWLPRPLADAAFGLVALVAAWEWAGLMKIPRGGRLIFAGFVLLSCLAAWNSPAFAYPRLWLMSAAFWLLLAPLWLWRGWRLAANDMVGYLVGWLLIVPTWAAMAGLRERDPWLLLAAMALVWIADIAAYFAGRTWGRVKLAPAISPGKTREGAYGALAAVLAYGAALALGVPQRLTPAELAVGALALVALTAISIVGDLFESLIKRQAEVKDSSDLLPGHGGVLDRIDSLTATLPLVALLLLGLPK